MLRTITLLLFLPLVARAENCEFKDHRQSPCLPKYKNQSDTNFCYAFSAAELASFEFCEEVSPVALGLLKSSMQKMVAGADWDNDGGQPDEAIEIGNKNGFCLEKEVPSQLITNGLASSVQRAYRNLESHPTLAVGACHINQDVGVQKFFPTADVIKLLEFIDKKQANRQDIYALAKASCKTKLKGPLKTERCAGSGEEKLEFLNKNIARAPVALAVRGDDYLPSWISGHAVTIIGRSVNEETHECGFLVRDSGAAAYSIGGITLGGDGNGETWRSKSEMLRILSSAGANCVTARK